MGKPYSIDLRERVVVSVLEGGLSRNKAAAQFAVAVSTVVIWVQRYQGRCHTNMNWRRKSESPNSGSSCRRGSPCFERFASEDAERVTGCEMALDVEGVVDGGVNRQKALG